MPKLPQARMNDLVVQEFETEVLIYDLKTNKAYCLNETSAMIWQMCDGSKTVAEISKSLSEKLKNPLTEDLIWLALDGFKKDNLLEESESFAVNFNGLNRRQIIKKVGLASMIMLPVIASVVAPQAVQAGSCIAIGQPCGQGYSLGGCCFGQGTCGLYYSCIPCTSPGGLSDLALDFCQARDVSQDCRNISECEICRDFGPTQCCSGQMNPIGGACL